MTQHYFSIALDFRSEWFWNAKKGNFERKELNMKIIYKIMKEKGFEVDINDWRDGTFYGNYVPYADITILMEATLQGSPNVVSWLLHELKFDVNEQNRNDNTALHHATIHDQIECARLLLGVGSQHLKDRSGRTPLTIAQSRDHEEMQCLIESHFQLN